MNTTNASMGFTPFQLRFGKSARILPPLIPPDQNDTQERSTHNLIKRMQQIQLEAQDNLLTAKIRQAHQENTHRQLGFPFKIRDRVVLSTKHRRHVYKSGDEPRIAKFMPRFDGPYLIIATNETHSTVTLALPVTIGLHSFRRYVGLPSFIPLSFPSPKPCTIRSCMSCMI